MQKTYKGFSIEVVREECMAGYDLVYYSVFCVKCGWCLRDGFEDGSNTVWDVYKVMKGIVDKYHEDPTQWEYDPGEHACLHEETADA